ncbi:uncharacterized protein LOC131951312 isoform X2 [Physella acuta]|uniref:uncharacterized protein LOC131951312 isoform X2 n=1 Tax=Physella acuta TaxID=109671 RepID=UPI0027DE7FB4|nr:uncharacterized protein LOC131951312 isoform X2 [Physella acuta]
MISTDSGSDLKTFCKEQEEVFNGCSSSIEQVYLASGDDIEHLCSGLSSYLNCFQDTKITCPKLPRFGDDIFLEAVDNTRVVFNKYCSDLKGLNLNTNCSTEVVARLVRHCLSFINLVQSETPRDKMCQLNSKYLKCLQGATKVCQQNNKEFLNHNIPQVMYNTEMVIKTLCEDMQGDDPRATAGKPAEKPVNPRACTDLKVQSQVNKCNAHLEQPPEVAAVSGCRSQKLYLQCMAKVQKNCPSAKAKYTKATSDAKKTFDKLCISLKCPATVEDGQDDVVSFCLKDLEAIEDLPDQSTYCRKLSDVRKCMTSTQSKCSTLSDGQRVDEALVMLTSVFKNNCR